MGGSQSTAPVGGGQSIAARDRAPFSASEPTVGTILREGPTALCNSGCHQAGHCVVEYLDEKLPRKINMWKDESLDKVPGYDPPPASGSQDQRRCYTHMVLNETLQYHSDEGSLSHRSSASDIERQEQFAQKKQEVGLRLQGIRISTI
eukprot:gnl/MRDRNA2_/MRDRNA2_103447_c0_seq1.p1 gnl/MRDRNA2_/MRDRNA2_103447_c0~~gnl/MRDRNA2_/MRDRNA2_103447_c0_seq1.p1  ORF type:complete len:148 (-),score=21.17 gnl/MRDRNA2_/MRDRNA2_103447_c0_seq1:90-533(-)